MTGAKLVGDKELLKAFHRIEAMENNKFVGDAAYKAATRIKNAAQRKAKQVAKRKTGSLSRAIKAKHGKGGGSAIVIVDYKIAPHSHLVEFGSGPRYQRSGKYVGQMSARPFFRPAVDENKARAARIIAKGVETAIEKAAKR